MAEFIRGLYMRLGRNIGFKETVPIRFNEKRWNEQFEYARKAGLNLVLIDVLEGVRYESHPEIACSDAKSVEWLRNEVKRLRAMGLEPIPEMNFSASHDGWLGSWRYCRCTPKYYSVCRELIEEVYDIFGKPRLFNIGMDEEDENHQEKRDLVCFRRGDLWWHDLLELVSYVEKCGARAWMWSDYGWNHPEEFVKRCPKSVMQSNWYFDECLYGFDPSKPAHTWYEKYMRNALKLYKILDDAGFDQIPTGSVWNADERAKKGVTTNDSMIELMAYSRKNLNPKLLKGFLMTPWVDYREEKFRALNEHAIDIVAHG